MQPREYSKLKRKLTHGPAFVPTFAIVALDAVLLCLVGVMVQTGRVEFLILCPLILAVVSFHSFAILHECGHGNVFRSPALNALLGHVVSVFGMVPYFPWKFIHREHHRWTGNMEKDPTLRALKERKEIGSLSLGHKIIWWSWFPFGMMIQWGVFWCFPFVLLKRESSDMTTMLKCFLSVAWLAMVYSLGISWLPREILVQTILPGVLCYFVLNELIHFPHHSDQPVFHPDQEDRRLALYEQHRTTRSCYYPPWIAACFLLNFNFHVEHHFFPNLPWHRLRKARDLIHESLGDEYTESVGINWNLKNRTRDPEKVFLAERYLSPDNEVPGSPS